MSSRTSDIVREGLLHVMRSPMRSLLTAFTSAIAIAVTVNVISLSFGFEDDIRGSVHLFGRRTVDVSRVPVLVPGAKRQPLGDAELARVREALADLGGVVVPRKQVQGSIQARGDGAAPAPQTMQVLAAPPSYLSTLEVTLAGGRWIGTDTSTCAVDAAVVETLFPGVKPRDAVGREIDVRIGKQTRRTRIVGVLNDPISLRALFDAFDAGSGARTLTSSLLSFRNVYVPAETVPDAELTGISVALDSEADIETARERLLAIWPLDTREITQLIRGGIGVFVRSDWMDSLGTQTAQGTILGNLIWIIVVLVAAVMISTLNLITIRERYDEVALRRCEGARRRDVALQITVEGVVLSLAGGVAGLPIGYLGARFLRQIVDFPFRFELRYALMATGVAVLLGLLSAVFPARHAARLQPARVLGRRLT